MIIQCFQENSELARVDVTKSFGLLLILSKPQASLKQFRLVPWIFHDFFLYQVFLIFQISM